MQSLGIFNQYCEKEIQITLHTFALFSDILGLLHTSRAENHTVITGYCKKPEIINRIFIFAKSHRDSCT